jgi:hypothetical protein
VIEAALTFMRNPEPERAMQLVGFRPNAAVS